MAPIWYQTVDSLETAGHHEEAVASNRLPMKKRRTDVGKNYYLISIYFDPLHIIS
jgi:hypothetical protein